MKVDNDLAKVLCELEYLIGSECYNPNSYDGWNDEYGRAFRYPINYPDGRGDFIKIRSKITGSFSLTSKDLTPEKVKFMKYKFGSNELFIGKGLVNVLTYLENRYGLDFAELERNHKE